jgi:hypothetical protein
MRAGVRPTGRSRARLAFALDVPAAARAAAALVLGAAALALGVACLVRDVAALVPSVVASARDA